MAAFRAIIAMERPEMLRAMERKDAAPEVTPEDLELIREASLWRKWRKYGMPKE